MTTPPLPATVVTFVDGRIGHRTDVPPLTVPHGTDLPDAVEAYARRFLGSRGVEVGYWPEDGIGRVMVGGFRTVGTFTLDPDTAAREAAVLADPPPDPQEDETREPVVDLAGLPTCARCPHSASAHWEDGPEAPPTACAHVEGDRSCGCTGYVNPQADR